MSNNTKTNLNTLNILYKSDTFLKVTIIHHGMRVTKVPNGKSV